jgi:hypothetical protein
MFNLLSTANPKIMKSRKSSFATYALHLAPERLSGVGNVCPKATDGCRAACLNTAGHGGMFRPGETTNKVQEARIRKTKLFFKNRAAFMELLAMDIEKAIAQAARLEMTPIFRLNCTSDLSWEKYSVRDAANIFELFPNVQFYDYTKVLNRKVGDIANYHLTFSRAESNDRDVVKAIKLGMNVAVVFHKVPEMYNDTVVFNGDNDDLRIFDPKGVIVGLKAKGRAKKDTSGFVV